MEDKEEMKKTEEYSVVRISSGKNKLYYYNSILEEKGFTFNERSFNNSFYEKKMQNNETAEWEQWCRWKRLRIDVIPEQYTRSSDYRKTFFDHNKPAVEAKYRCAYCGRKFLYKDTTVDHIFPVNELSYSSRVRKMAAKRGIYGANDEKNLVAACRKCNSKKGTKMGIWILRGFIGKSETFWRVRTIFRTTLAIMAVCAVGYGFFHIFGITRQDIAIAVFQLIR